MPATSCWVAFSLSGNLYAEDPMCALLKSWHMKDAFWNAWAEVLMSIGPEFPDWSLVLRWKPL